jgi:hypothetical protein
MATTIKLKNGSGAPLAGDLVQGEPAFDLTNKRLYTEDSGGTVIEVGTNPSTLTVDTDTLVVDAANNRVGIGTASPSYLVDARTASGNAQIHLRSGGDLAQLLLISNDTTGNSQINFGDADSNNIGIVSYSHNENALKFTANASERMRIDSSGNVGIGVTPLGSSAGAFTQLQMGGTSGHSTFFGQSNDHAIGMVSGAYYDASNNLKYSSTSSKQISRVYLYDGEFEFSNAPAGTGGATATVTQRMKIDSSGNVGIGTTSPNYPLHLNKSDSAGCWAQFTNSTTGTGTGAGALVGIDSNEDFRILQYEAKALALYTSATERMRIDSSGRIGIGTASPARILHVENNGLADLLLRDTSSYSAGTGPAVIFQGKDSGGTTTQFGAIYGVSNGSNSGELTFETRNSGSSAERMRIDSSGNLILKPSGKLYLESSSGFSPYLVEASNALTVNTNGSERMRIDSSGAALVGATSASNTTGTGVKLFPEGYGGASTAVGIVGASSTGANSGFRMYSTGASAYRFYVDYAGTIFATSTSISAISDASLKENVRDLDKGLDTINALQPRRFDWKNGDGNDIMGFIAQEVEEVMPELVHEYKYSDEENKKGLKMGDMVPSMVKAIQELSAQVNELKAEVAALKGA